MSQEITRHLASIQIDGKGLRSPKDQTITSSFDVRRGYRIEYTPATGEVAISHSATRFEQVRKFHVFRASEWEELPPAPAPVKAPVVAKKIA